MKEVSFFQALDAVCRAHGGVTYLAKTDLLAPPQHLTLMAEPWLEYPCVYVEDSKILVDGCVRRVVETPSARTEFTEVYLSILLPPDRRFAGSDSEAKSWSILRVRGKNEGDLPLLKSDRSETRLELKEPSRALTPNRHCFWVQSFPLEEGLQLLEGSFEGTIAETEDVQIPLEKGKEVRIPQGTLTVTAITPVKQYSWTETRVTLSFRPNGKDVDLKTLFERYGNYDGSKEGWSFLSPEFGSGAVKFELSSESPRWMTIRIRKNPRAVKIPFRFSNLAFPKGTK